MLQSSEKFAAALRSEELIQLKYTIALSAPKTMRRLSSVEWSYFIQKCIKFHLQPFRFEKYSKGRNPGRGGINRFLSLKEEKGWKVQGRPRDGTGKNGGRTSGGDLAPKS